MTLKCLLHRGRRKEVFRVLLPLVIGVRRARIGIPAMARVSLSLSAPLSWSDYPSSPTLRVRVAICEDFKNTLGLQTVSRDA